MVDSHGNGRPTGLHEADERPLESPGRLSKHVHARTQNHERIGEARIIKNTPQFQQVTAFSQWCPPTRKAGPQLRRVGYTEAAWNQRNALLRHYPEALFGDMDTASVLAEEIRNLREPAQPLAASTTRLIATGEISDLSETTVVTGHPVLATAAGQLGDTLRLVSLVKQPWTWTQEEVAIELNAPGLRFEKEWFQDRTPISCIKFALDLKRQDPIRWLIVQKASSTTIYEPELRAIATETVDSTVAESCGPLKLFANPLCTVQRDQTGGGSQSDVAFTSVSGEVPQLAIIDEYGYWSLWDIAGRKGVGRPRSLKLTMRVQGNIYSGAIPRFPSSVEEGKGGHTLLLLSAKNQHLARRRSRDGSDLPSEMVDQDSPRPFLLMSSRDGVYQHDIDTGVSKRALEDFLDNSPPVLDIAKSNLDPSEAFILTDKNLIWVAAGENKRKDVALDVLVSCPHRKERGDSALRLEVSPGTYVNGQKGCFVCIRSNEDTQLTIFWFVRSKSLGAQYRREVIDLRAPSRFIGMSMLPVARGNRKADAGLALALAEAKARFFQILLLSDDLDVNSALCVWSDDSDLRVRPPDMQVNSDLEESRRERLELLSDLSDRFQGLKTVDEDNIASPSEGPSVARKRQTAIPGPSTINLNLPLPANRPGPWQGFEVGDDGDVGELDSTNGHPIVDKLEFMFGDLPRGGNRDPHTTNLQSTLEAIAAQILHEEIDVSALPRRGSRSQQINPGRFSREPSQDFLSSSMQFQSSQAFPSSQLLPSSPAETPQPVDEGDDPVVNHLRGYMHIDPMLPGESSTALIGPFDWEIGGDPDAIDWRPGQQSLEESLAKAIKRKKKVEAKRRRAEKLTARVLGTGTGEESGYGSSTVPTSQRLPRIMASSQVTSRDMGMSSSMPVFSSQVGQSQNKSQVFAGKFGGRIGGGKKKKKTKSGFR